MPIGGIRIGVERRKIVGYVTALFLAYGGLSNLYPQESNWSGTYAPCIQHFEILKHEHMDLGVRFSTADLGLATEFARAMDFWATILDMDWHEENSRDCAIQVVDGAPDLFKPAQAARAQLPGRPAFQGWIAFNPKIVLSETDKYFSAVHELGHLFGLRHNPSPRSVMFYVRLFEHVSLEGVDLSSLARRHKLRVVHFDQPVTVPAPGLDAVVQ